MIATRKSIVAMTLCFGAVLGASATANAQKGARKVQNPNAPVIGQLHMVHASLHKADHDYQGHRVKAMHHIHVAVKALGPAGKHVFAKGTPGTGKLPQSVSDGILQQAAQQLTMIQTALANSAGPGNRAAAVTAIQSAIGELQTALKIR